MTRYEKNSAQALCDLVNFVLKCAGCELQVDLHDIEDPDHATSKLTDIQDEFQRLKVTDYPLLSKARGQAASFRSTMNSFFDSVIVAAHAAGILYSDETLMENLLVWVTSLSSSSIRPFRHTATAVALGIANTICGLTAEIGESVARTMKQKEGEQKKKKVNRERVDILQAKIVAEEERQKTLGNILEDIFSTVYVHRYRDVEPKIRVDCITALGTWITTAPEVFFSGQYIRYLGWMLADIHAPTRAEVIKQLSKLFKNKDNVGRLRAFTERFQPRMVEMASRDAEVSIRTAAIDLLDMVRETGLLESENIDTIGRLIFDKEPRVRKAVGGFIAESVNDLYESAAEDLGGEEVIEEYLGEEGEDDYDSPRISWLKFLCLAEVLDAYAAESQDESQQPVVEVGVGALNINVVESRVALAAQAIYENVDEIKDWEFLAGYLVFDHSSLPTDKTDPVRAFRVRCQPNEGQEILLLEILHVAVKTSLVEAVKSEMDKKGKKSKARIEASSEIQIKIAIHLAQVIPQLLKKFGSNPATATAVLRLEHVLNLEIFQELRQDSTTYSSLLDDINKQFLTHADQRVLSEASNAILHARSFEDLEETTEKKVQELWEDTVNTLRMLVDSDLHDRNLIDLCNTVRRIAYLASVSDCVEVFNQALLSSSKQGQNNSSPYNILLELLNTHLETPESDPEASNEVDELMLGAIKALLFHNMWASLSLRNALEVKTSHLPDPPSYESFAQTLQSIMSSRKGIDPVRLAAATSYLDLHTLFASFRYIDMPPSSSSGDNIIKDLCQPISPRGQSLLLTIFSAVEKQFAKKTHCEIDLPPEEREIKSGGRIDSEPEDSDLPSADESFSESDDEVAGNSNTNNSQPSQRKMHMQKQKALAEQMLCELAGKLVIAIRSDLLLPSSGSIAWKSRLERNKSRLGNNYKEILAHLARPVGPSAATAKQKKNQVGKKISDKKIKDIVEEHDNEDEEQEEEEEEDDDDDDDEAGEEEQGEDDGGGQDAGQDAGQGAGHEVVGEREVEDEEEEVAVDPKLLLDEDIMGD